MRAALSATLTLRESIEYSAMQHIPIGYYSLHYSVIVQETSRYVCALIQQIRIFQRVTVKASKAWRQQLYQQSKTPYHQIVTHTQAVNRRIPCQRPLKP
jgi:hypothetical protein